MQKIYRIGNHQVVCYAARELARYLTQITGEDIFEIEERKFYKSNQEGIWLGLDKELGLELEVPDKKLDDSICIGIHEGQGIIVGTNERSILIGVYRFLTELGCRWLRPCKDGEKIIHKKLSQMHVVLEEKASLRHRGIVIEGANSYENVVDLIDWMPKVGYNSYFIQFMYAYSFFKQWYAHEENPLKQKEFFNDEMAIEFTKGIGKELEKRGLIHHAVGHGWTCECIGIKGRGWGAEDIQLTKEQQECLALVKGKREFFGGVPLNTNLCYSNPNVQERFINSVVDYAKEHKGVDKVHVWLADDFNNHCECETCKTEILTDWYIQILNRLDEKLTGEGLSHKIVFLLYFELLWPPAKERIKNPDRFLMMFAPISRTFTQSFNENEEELGEIEDYELNRIKLPTSITDYLRFLNGWKRLFDGDSFDFDYHLGRAHYGDAGYYEIAKIISKDIKHLKRIGLNGLLSCQQQRTFFPTALPSYVMAKTLWNTDLEFEKIAIDYFRHAFGENWEVCKAYLMNISEVFDMDYWHIERGRINKAFAEKVIKAHAIVDTYKAHILNNQDHTNETEKLSWNYIRYHLEYTKLLASALAAKANGEEELAIRCWSEFANYICIHEDELQRALDVFRILMIGRNFCKFKRE